MRTLGPLNAPIQSEAIIEFSESDFDSETLKMASHWTGTFKGPTVMCVPRGSLAFTVKPLCLHLCLMLVHE